MLKELFGALKAPFELLRTRREEASLTPPRGTPRRPNCASACGRRRSRRSCPSGGSCSRRRTGAGSRCPRSAWSRFLSHFPVSFPVRNETGNRPSPAWRTMAKAWPRRLRGARCVSDGGPWLTWGECGCHRIAAPPSKRKGPPPGGVRTAAVVRVVLWRLGRALAFWLRPGR